MRNVKVNIKFRDDYDSYIERVILKKDQNIKSLTRNTYEKQYILKNLEH